MDNRSPLFSIIIPTRNRAHLLPNALRSAINQQFHDYEIVVVANDCKDNTKSVVEAFKNDKIRYFETDRALSMHENWEFAWTKAKGEYVTYLCDDDALTPRALTYLAENTLNDKLPIISWEDAIYYYPDWNDSRLQNILLLFYFGDIEFEDVPAKFYLNQLTQFDFAWSSPLPKLLNCLAHRPFFENWRKQNGGKLFYPFAPDYSFAWIASHICSNIRVVHQPFSIRGISDHSIGSNAGLGEAAQAFLREFGGLNSFEETQLNLPLSINHLACTFLRINTIFSEKGREITPLDKDAFCIALSKQLKECRDLLPDWPAHKKILLDYAKKHNLQAHDKAALILSESDPQPKQLESLRDMHKRTAKAASEYSGNLINATKFHDGDEECGACTLALKKEILVESNWKYLYLFGETVGAFNPYDISLHVDKYYELMTKCKKKKNISLGSGNHACTSSL